MIYLHFFAAEPCAPHDKLVFCPPFCLQADPARNFPGVLSSLVRSYHGVTFPEVIPLAAGHSIFKVQCLLTRTILPKKTAINDRPDYKFELGKGIVLREGKDLTIIANGLCVAPALEAAEKLAADGVDAKVINIHTIKPLDEELVVAAAKETGKVVTVEEHSVIGGLGGAVCECLSEKAPVPVKRIGVNDVFGESGPATALLEKYGLDAEGIYKQIKEFV